MNQEILCDICKKPTSQFINGTQASYYLKHHNVDGSVDKLIIRATCSGHLGLHSVVNWSQISQEEYVRYKKLETFR